jgi:cell division protein FtsL
MTRLNLILLIGLLLACVLLVRTAYDSRRLYTLLDNARNEEQQLQIEFKRLDAERQAQATHGRVDRVARDKLQMRTANTAITQYVDVPSGMTLAASASTAGSTR